MINIFRIIKGVETTVCRVADSNASVVNEIMGREEITVNTTVESPLPVEVGDYVRLDGTVYTLNREPDFEKTSDVEYHYNLLFESPLYRLLDKLFTNPLTGVSKFSVARTLAEFVRFITENMNKIDSGWAVSKDIPASEPKNLSFEAASCRDVLNMLSGEFSAEYFLDGKIICFKERIENKTNLVFEQGKGKGLYSISQEPVDSENTVTRIYPYGSTQNMLPGKGDVNGRLFLPEGYLENFSEYNKVVEKEVEFNDVYPRFTGVVDTVSGQDNLVLKCASVNFDVAAQAIGGVPVKINFLSGNLMGESFEFGWDNPTKTITLKLKEDENAQADKDGKKPLIPHALKKVVAGDSFNFTDLKMPETPYLTSAIAELRAKATDWLAYYSRSRVKFTLQVDHRYLRGKRVLRAGDLITIRFPETGVDKLLRIVSTERSLSTGKITCTVSNYLDEKWEKKIEGAISSLKSSASSSTAGGLTINIIKEEDITPASDRNVYSALRSSGEFLNKTHADTATAPLTFARGLTATDGILTDTLNVTDRATVASLDVAGTAEAEVLNVSVEATAASLGVTGNTATGSLNVSGNTTSASLDVANNISAGSLDVSSLAKAGSIDVEDLARTKMLQVSGLAQASTLEVAGLTKTGNTEVANNAKTKDLEVSEIARIRDLVVTRLAEVLNLSVTDTATLAKTIVKESIGTDTFIPGFTGEGWKIWKLAAGWNLEIDTLTIRKTLTAFELLISKIRSVNGALAITQGNGKIKNVLDQTTVYVIEIEDTMSFVSGDLVRCQTWQSAGSKYYWVTVTRVEGNSIICNKSEFNGIVPAAGDELVQMGNVSNTARQSMIYLDASSGRPSIDVLSGINTKSFDNKLKVRLGCLDGITDTDFPSNMQPSGDGIYCTNGFFKGMFVLRSGKTVEDYTGEAVDAIQIGVRNFVKNSAVNETSNMYGFGKRYLTKDLEPGKTYTFVANGRVDQQALDDNKYLGVYLYEGTYYQQKVLVFNSLVNETKQVTFTLSDTLPAPTNVMSYLHPLGGNRTGNVTVNWYMLIEGNKVPDSWIEAPEDTVERIQEAKDAADAAQGDANTAKATADTAVTNAATANALLSDIASDSKLTPSEKQATKKEWDIIISEKVKNVASATTYAVSSTTYTAACTTLGSYLTPLIGNLSTTSDIVGATFRTNFKAYYDARTDLLNTISAKSKELADKAQLDATTAGTAASSAQRAADRAQGDANIAKDTADAATTRLNNWAADGTISPVEKLALKQEQKALTDEKTQIVADAVKYVVSSTAYVTAFTNYNAELTYHTTATPENIVIRASFAANQTAYYAAKQAVLNAIATATKKLATDAQTAANTANRAVERIDTELSVLPRKITAAVTSEVDKIQIGGVNLMDNSAVERHGPIGLEGAEYLKIFDPTAVFDKMGVGVYTFSFDAKSAIEGSMQFYSTPGVKDNFKYIFKTVNGADVFYNGFYGVSFNITTEYKRYSFVIEIVESNQEALISSISLYGVYGSGRVPYAKNIKLEQGNKATAWTPSMEDSAAALEVVRTELDSRLAITEKDIIQKVSKTDFNDLGQRVGTAEASIKTQADKIALTVTKEEFNNLQIGTKNLILNSKLVEGWIGNAGKYNIRDFDQSLPTEIGNRYTLVINYINTAGDGCIGVWLNGQGYYGDFPLSTSVVTKKMTFTARERGTVTLYHRPAGSSGTSTVYWAMLFEGDKAPDIWQAAPEDTDAVISRQEARIKLTEGGITSQASSISGLTNRMQTAEQNITPESITQTVRSNVKVGSRNYLRGSRIDNLEGWNTFGGTFNLMTDEKMGTVVEYSRPDGGSDYQKTFAITHAELSNTDLVYFVIAKRTSASGLWAFGGWSATVNKLSSASNTIDLGNGWYQYWVAFKSGDAIGTTFGINTISGTWRFYAAGVLKGTAPTDWTPAPEDRPTFDEIESEFQQTANGFRLRGTEISLQGKVTFSMLASDSQNTINGKATPTDVKNAKEQAITAAATDATTKAGNAKTEAINAASGDATKKANDAKAAAIADARNNVAEKLGYAGYADMEAEALAGQTIITGGKIRTSLIDTDVLIAKKLASVTGTIGGFNITANSLYAGTLFPGNGIGIIKTDEAGCFIASRGGNDYCMLYNYNAGAWGLIGRTGSAEVFHLGSRNQIAGWTFDNEALYTGVKAAPDVYSTGGITLRNNGSISSKNFRITANGDVFGKNCAFENGTFTGEVTATTGTIGGFEISENNLRASKGMSLNEDGVIFSGSNIYAGLGVSSGPSVMGIDVPLWIENNGGTNIDTSIAAYFSATGAFDPYNNIAIALGGGCISGLAFKVRKITYSQKLRTDDTYVSCYNTSNMILDLPTGISIGKVLFVKLINDVRTEIRASSAIIKVGTATSLYNISVFGATMMLVWDGQFWCANRLTS